MSVFNFMETFFFISLGITFILILLLVYHFKQRLSTIETKSDTMFEIINNIVKEMGVIKVLASRQNSVPSVPHPLSMFMESQRPLNEIFGKMDTVDVKEINLSQSGPSDIQEINLAENQESDKEDYDDEDDEDDSDDEEEEEADNDEEYISEDVEEDERVVVSDDESEKEEEVEPEDVNVIQDEVETDEVKVIQITDTVESIEVVEETPIVVNKLENTTEESDEKSSESSSDDPMEEFKKLPPAALKTLILSKGYATDVGKLKKPQLLNILADNLKSDI